MHFGNLCGGIDVPLNISVLGVPKATPRSGGSLGGLTELSIWSESDDLLWERMDAKQNQQRKECPGSLEETRHNLPSGIN